MRLRESAPERQKEDEAIRQKGMLMSGCGETAVKNNRFNILTYVLVDYAS